MAQIFIRDDLPPESLAMAQALYSRSPDSVVEHLKKIEVVGADHFMERYYRGYGHDSIGDCGSTTLFIENVSMLAAKAIQDWPLYRGQEASTRYMDFSSAIVENPVESFEGTRIQENWMYFYRKAEPIMLDHLHAQYPRAEGEDEAVYERAIKARSFDVLRAFLPAGVTTNLSWHTDLRQANDHLIWLRRHPDLNISEIGDEIYAALLAKYPSSFGRVIPQDVSTWYNQVAEHYTYEDDDGVLTPRGVTLQSTIDERKLPRGVQGMMQDRPKRAVLPHWASQYGSIKTRMMLDFGSFRDLQRHRNGVVRMPLLTESHGFHRWYLEQLPAGLSAEAWDLINSQSSRIQRLDASKEQRQYYFAMGYRVVCNVTQGLPAFLYRVELRTSPSVHPTLREQTQNEVLLFRMYHPSIACHADMSPDTWNTRRGKQTIIEKA